MKIYFEKALPDLINVTYDIDGERIYDAFKSLAFFNSWIESDYSYATLIEITDENYHQLAEEGVI